MKKIMLLSMMMVLALAVGSAYADESATWALSEPHNGITLFSAGPVDFDNILLGTGVASHMYAEGSAAGGWREEEAMTEPYLSNGITILSEGPVSFDTVVTYGEAETIGAFEEGSAAGGLHVEDTALPENGITIFSTEPVAYDNVPSGAGW
jgi:hypothetical protein